MPAGRPAAATAQLEERFEQREGAFDVHRYDDEATARTAIEERAVYGAVVVTGRGLRLLTASAAGPVVAGARRGGRPAMAAERREATPVPAG